MAKTTKTKVTASSENQKTDARELADIQARPQQWFVQNYTDLCNRLGVEVNNASPDAILTRSGLKLSQAGTRIEAALRGVRGGFPAALVIQELRSAGCDIIWVFNYITSRQYDEGFYQTPWASSQLNEKLTLQLDYLNYYTERLIAIGFDPFDHRWDTESRSPTSSGYVDQKTTAGIPQSTGEAINSWVKQTGFQAPSPLAPTKGSKGLLGNCSPVGEIVTGIVVGGAIFALYKTCKK